MSECKYIMFKDNIPILFPVCLTHIEMANHLHGLRPATSAGFVQVYVETFESEVGYVGVEVFGESVSLKLKANPMDAGIIKKLFK